MNLFCVWFIFLHTLIDDSSVEDKTVFIRIEYFSMHYHLITKKQYIFS